MAQRARKRKFKKTNKSKPDTIKLTTVVAPNKDEKFSSSALKY